MQTSSPIIVAINNLGIGGAERLVVDQVNELHRRGIPAKLLTCAPEKMGRSFMSACELPERDRVYIRFRSLYDFGGWWRLISFLRQNRHATLVTHLWFANTVGRVAGVAAGIKQIIPFEHNVYDDVKTKRQFLIDRFLQGFSTRIVAVSNAVAESLVAHHIQPSRIVVIPNGIDLRPYRPTERRESGKAFTYLFVGRLIEQKGVDVLLRAYAKLADGSLVIAGEGEDRAALENLAGELGILERVQFLGIRNDVPALMRKADCFVLPSRWEGMPMVLIEALASGLPVITTDFASAPQVINDGTSGLIVPRDNVEALSEAMRRVAGDAGLRASLSADALHEAERFSISREVDAVLTLLA